MGSRLLLDADRSPAPDLTRLTTVDAARLQGYLNEYLRVGGIPELVVDGYNGFLITPGDTAGLAQRLMILAAEPGLRSLMGRRSREIAAREYDVAPYVERLVTLYESIVERERTFGNLGRHEDSARHHQLPA